LSFNLMMTQSIDSSLAIEHLPGIGAEIAETSRLRIHYLKSGPAGGGEPVLFIHGNGAASTWWEETMLALPAGFRGIAPDLRGYGLTDRGGLIDATRGVKDWVDDLNALLVTLAVEEFHLVGHSLGGIVSWGVVADPRFAGRIRSVTLAAPGPPCGFGGVHGEEGEANNRVYTGSGAGLVNRRFVKQLKRRDRGLADPMFSPRAVMNRMFWKQTFRCPREEDFLTALLQVHLGRKRFPGDFRVSRFWPWMAPGRHGPINAMSPKYNESLLRNVIEAPEKPPLLLILGSDDPIISDLPGPDAGTQGKLGMLPGWPGDDVFPPQPVKTQILAALRRYAGHGGTVEQLTFADCGHSPFVEKPLEFRKVFHEFLRG
jgi:pimeloyl-ACP methyl ester carboxylesterase